MSIKNIKEAIKTNLDKLVTAEVLAGATITDIRKSPLDADISAYPHAFIMPPATESDVLDNRSVTRTHTFEIMVLFNTEDLASSTQLEEKIEALMSEFDNDPTLSGTAIGGVLPVSSAPQPFQHGGKDLIMTIIEIKAKETVPLSFQ